MNTMDQLEYKQMLEREKAVADRVNKMLGIPPKISKSTQEEVAELRDALDHIARVARSARSQSRRDRWIAQRAQSAIDGNDIWREIDYPKCVNVHIISNPAK